MATYYEVWNNECSICLNNKQDYYFNNQCLCTHLICENCISKIIKYPYCRQPFSNSIIDMYTSKTDTIIVNNVYDTTNSYFHLYIRIAITCLYNLVYDLVL